MDGSISEGNAIQNSVEENRGRKLRLRRRLTITGLLSPALLLLAFPFLVSMLMLFSNSAYHFNGFQVERIITFDAYRDFFTDPFYADMLTRSLSLALTTTTITLAISYPVAYAIARLQSQRLKILFYILIFSPLLTSIVTRAFGWLVLLGNSGFINYMLVQTGLVDEPIRLIYNLNGVIIAMVHIQLPFAVFPIISVLNRIEPVLKEAAGDLGGTRWDVFRRVTWPLSLPGVIVAVQITFIQAVSAFVAPSLLGGGRVMVLPRLIYDSLISLNWPLASVLAMVLLSISLTILFISNRLFRLVYQAPVEVNP